MFGIDPVQLAKKELLKVDLNKDKVPDVIQALDAAEAGCDFLANFLAGFDADEAAAVLNFLNSFRKEANRLPVQEINAAAAKVVLLPSALRGAKAALEGIEKELGS